MIDQTNTSKKIALKKPILQVSGGIERRFSMEEFNEMHAERIALGNARLGNMKYLAGFIRLGRNLSTDTRAFIADYLAGKIKKIRTNGLDADESIYLNKLVFYVRDYQRQRRCSKQKTIEAAAQHFGTSSGTPGDNGVQRVKDDLKKAKKNGMTGSPILTLCDDRSMYWFGEI